MLPTTLSTRKPDALDIWEKLYFERYEAYQQGDMAQYKSLNNRLKDLRRNGGWSETEIQQEFAVYDLLLVTPYKVIPGNPSISYDLIEDGRPRNLVLNISQVSIYWKYRQYGKHHSEALYLTT